MQVDSLRDLVVEVLDGQKAVDISVLDVRHVASFTDFMVVASGTSGRHVRSMADRVVEKARESGVRALGVEGSNAAEWVLIDLGDVVVHVMQPTIRGFYSLEKLWSTDLHAEDDLEAGG